MTFEDPVRDVHVWCTFCDEIRDEPLLEDYERLLSADERQRRSRFATAHAGEHRIPGGVV
jgi:hypothetical protein